MKQIEAGLRPPAFVDAGLEIGRSLKLIEDENDGSDGSGGRSEEIFFRKLKKIPASYLINPLFVNFKVLVENLQDGEHTFLTDIVFSFHHHRFYKLKKAKLKKLKIIGSRHLSTQEIRRVRILILNIKRQTSFANKLRIKFLKRLNRYYK